MSIKYDPDNDLELGMFIGTAVCTEIAENFATLEDTGWMNAKQLQTLFDGGWRQQFTPIIREGQEAHSHIYIYTFFNEGIGF